ncbi:MAG: hypothetical protein E7653_00750 [Ruminococcaceae bacterium]|nr:hypothetical protein [Oscillospiraceae bacterium]
MKGFFGQYSYSIIKMFVNQFAISIFGSVLAMATAASGNKTLTLVVSIFAIIFYLFLIYTMTWEIGAKDKISVDVGKKPYRPYIGLLMSLVANIPNFIIAIVYTIGYRDMAVAQWAGTMTFIARVASIFTEGMYLGFITAINVAGNPIQHYWWAYFVITIPAIITSWIAYFAGHKNFRIVAGFFNKKPDTANKK